jgi:hypothetical protein
MPRRIAIVPTSVHIAQNLFQHSDVLELAIALENVKYPLRMRERRHG